MANKAKELHNETIESLELMLAEARAEKFRLINKVQLEKKMDKPHLIPQARKRIAQIETLIRAKQLASMERG